MPKRMAQECNYNVDFRNHENYDLYEAWFKEKSQLQIREFEGLFGFECSDGKYSKTDENFNVYLVLRFEEEVAAGWSLKSNCHERIQGLLIKDAPEWYTCIIEGDIDREKYSFATEAEAVACCTRESNCEIEKERLLPKGEYFIGDPTYVLKEEYWHYLNVEKERGVFQDPNGIIFGKFRTLMGDGIFADDEGGEYGVDSGCIAVLPTSVCDEEKIERAYGEVYEMMAPFVAEWEPEDGEEGDIRVGNIRIHTNPLRDNKADCEDIDIALLADQKYDDGQFAEAIDLYNQAIRLLPLREDLFVGRGLAKEMLSDDEGAITDYKKATEINPNSSMAWFYLGSILTTHTWDQEEPIALLTKSIEIDPTNSNSDAYRYRGIARSDNENHDEALSDFSKLIEFDSNDGQAHLMMGYTYIKLGDYQASVHCLNKSIEVFEKNAGDEYDLYRCYLYLGNAKSKLGETDDACKNWKMAAELGSEDARIMHRDNCL